jgi:glutamate N-acetyltransferase/amino-acid N-acetyltransferase
MAPGFRFSSGRISQKLVSFSGYICRRNGQIRLYTTTPVDTSIPNSKLKFVPQSGTYPRGFAVSGTHVGVKASNTTFPDLALILSETPCAAAAVFTTNKFQAAPVQVSKRVLQTRKGKDLRAVVVNAGCANAVTGKGGVEDAWSMAAAVDRCIGASAQDPEDASTLVMSTGVIGQR